MKLTRIQMRQVDRAIDARLRDHGLIDDGDEDQDEDSTEDDDE